jgi:hypothetical protein
MLCDSCWEFLPKETVPGTAVRVMTPCHHRVHTRCQKEGEGCQVCAEGKKWERNYMVFYLVLLGLAFGYCILIGFSRMKQETAALGKDIHHDLAQIEAMAETSTLWTSLQHVHASASLQRIRTTVKHEVMQLHSSA